MLVRVINTCFDRYDKERRRFALQGFFVCIVSSRIDYTLIAHMVDRGLITNRREYIAFEKRWCYLADSLYPEMSDGYLTLIEFSLTLDQRFAYGSHTTRK